MKKLLLLLIALFMFATVSNAQELGIRFGVISGGNVAVDGVFALGSWSRIHAGVSFGSSGVGLDAVWDFLYKPLSGEAFYWYAGVGAFTFLGTPFSLGATGELGLEYRFNQIPISLSADWRPYFAIVENTSFDAGNFGINVRYIF
ncbi:MAG: outer membrane insertion C- signal [Chlorobi bacterium]|nr:outer membrane insertion C- signal [Chlorobiota bacterium]